VIFIRFLSFLILLIACNKLVTGQPASVIISEFMAVNENSIEDSDGENSDWIEVLNISSDKINLKGWSLSDSRTNPGKWYFPEISLNSGEYLIVFASGKNRRVAGKELHTNFSLKGDGEYLDLRDSKRLIATSFNPGYPSQNADISYGFLADNIPVFLDPSPGTKNLYMSGPELASPLFGRKHGFFYSPFNLTIETTDTDAKIYYTTNGSEPDLQSGILYNGPIEITTTSVIRAVAIKPGWKPGKSITQSFLFPDDIINQPALPPGYPSQWGPYTGISGTAVADYGMDAEVLADPNSIEDAKKAFMELPSISIVTKRGFLFSRTNHPDTGGIYIYTGPPLTNTKDGIGVDWERPASFEYFTPDGSESLQVNCGLQLHGGHSRRPEKSPKHSFRIEFKKEYGPENLDYKFFGEDGAESFNSIVLRAGFNNSWVHHSSPERIGAPFIQDSWAKDTHREMGHLASNGFFAHLFINGLYWGIYNPSEKLDKDYAVSYMGGEASDFDVIKDYNEVSDGNGEAWKKLMFMVNSGVASDPMYQFLLGNNADGTRDYRISPMVDPVSLSDYMILNFYAGNSDWDHHNWVAMRSRVNPDKGFTFFSWDEEKILENKNANILKENNNNSPSRVFQQMRQNSRFQRLFADRVQKLCFDDGPLTPEKSAAIWKNRSLQIKDALILESARWGDYRRDVHRYQSAGPFDLYTVNKHWMPVNDTMLISMFPDRRDIFVAQLRAAGLFPLIDAPVFKINMTQISDNEILRGDLLTIEAETDNIYYTTDGTDPVVWNTVPVVSTAAKRYSEAIKLDRSTHIKARYQSGTKWSATSDRFFLVKEDQSDLKITEVNYNPFSGAGEDGREYEFIEIKNTGQSTLDLAAFRFKDGVEYRFNTEKELAGGKFIVLASNAGKFFERYGFFADGEYSGQLDNAGDQLTLFNKNNEPVCSLLYSSGAGWPQEANGFGNSMVPLSINPEGSQNDPALWRSSYFFGGSPGKDDLFEPGEESISIVSPVVALFQNFPNPFADYTYICYRIYNNCDIELSVFNNTGQKVVTLEKGSREAGEYVTGWRGNDEYGGMLPTGIYFYRISIRYQGKETIVAKKVVIAR